MESKLVLHAKTRHINVYAHPENVTHLTKEKIGNLTLQGGIPAYVKQFIDDHNQDESAHQYIQDNLSTHISDTSNPHSVTRAQVGLGNVDNTADLDKPISTATQTALDGKQATISDLETIRSGAALGTTAVQPGDLATVATTGDYGDLTNKPTIPSQASDVHALPDTTKYGASLDLDINSSTYVVTAQLKDQDGNALGTAQTIDLPLESVVVNGSYDSATKKVVLTLQNGSTVEFSVADLVAGLQSEITSSNKLSADLVDDTSTTNKFVTSAEKSTWNDKQDAISDLATIRSGAALGATSVQQSDITDVYRENNLIPETPVEFNSAVSTDYYTTTGNATITNGILTTVSSGNDCYANISISDFNELEMVFKAKRYTWPSAATILPICAFGAGNSTRRITPNASSDADGGTRLIYGSTIVVNIPNSYFDLQTYGPLGYYTRLKVTKTTSDYTYELGLSADGKTWVTNSANYSSNMCTGAVYFLRNSSGSTGSNGEMDLNKSYIKVDGKYLVPPLSSTIVSVPTMTGATSSAAGAKGLVPTPAAGDEAKFLRGDGTWVGSTSSIAWGAITGTLSDQTDLQAALNAKQDNISDLSTIRSGASAGATAVQPATLESAINSVKRNIGELVQSHIPLTDAGLHLLDGSLLSNGSYSDFITYMAGVYSSNPELFDTEANWQQSVSDYGVCGKFVYDSVNNTVRLPKLSSTGRYLIKSYSSGTSWYRIYSDGWCEQGGSFSGTSITFSKEFIDTNYGFAGVGTDGNTAGAANTLNLNYKLTTGCTYYTHGNNGGLWRAFGYVDISSYKVDPLYQYIVISNSTKTEIEVDIDEIATDLNGKADTDLSNVIAAGSSTAAGWAMPSGVYEDLTLGASGSTYTAPANGWLVVKKNASAQHQELRLTNNANGLIGYIISSSSNATVSASVQCKKGQTISIYYALGGSTQFCHFIYAEGSKTEAN